MHGHDLSSGPPAAQLMTPTEWSLSEACGVLGLPVRDPSRLAALAELVLRRYESERGASPPVVSKTFTVSQTHEVYTYDEQALALIREEAHKLYGWQHQSRFLAATL